MKGTQNEKISQIKIETFKKNGQKNTARSPVELTIATSHKS